MVAGLQGFCCFALGQTGADGQAVTQAFGGGDHIRQDAVVLVFEIGAGTAVGGLNLIQYQQPAVVVADFA